MSGHSKWSSIKHKKAAADSLRGKAFTKLIKEITVAAKAGGGKPEVNPTLRTAITKAKEANMPADNIERAIKKGTGELPGVVYEEIMYEGYGPGGVAILAQALTDNKNRASSEIRNIFAKKGGNLAGAGAVSWIFSKRGFIIVDKKGADEDKVMTIALDNGADDMVVSDTNYEITTSVQNFEKVKKALDDNKIAYQLAEITMHPSSTVKLEGSQAKVVLALVDELEDHDDVQNVYANFDIPDEILQQMEGA